MSVAIIPMARQYGWSATISGLVQSAFFYGYTLCQLPSGFLNTAFSGARMLPIGVGLWSTATTIVPFQGSSVVGLCASRAVVGIGEAVAPGALTDLVASVVPITERSRSMTFVGAALYLGSLLGRTVVSHSFALGNKSDCRTVAIAGLSRGVRLAIGFLCLWWNGTGMDHLVGAPAPEHQTERSANIRTTHR